MKPLCRVGNITRSNHKFIGNTCQRCLQVCPPSGFETTDFSTTEDISSSTPETQPFGFSPEATLVPVEKGLALFEWSNQTLG